MNAGYRPHALRSRAWTPRLRRTAWALPALLLLACLTRLPAMAHSQPIDDEGVFAVVANTIVDGGVPYRDAIERKPPLLFYSYAAVFSVFGRSNWLALHLTGTAWVFGTMLGIALLATDLDSSDACLFAAAAYALFLSIGGWRNLAFSGEMLMNLAVVWSWAVAFGRRRRRTPVRLFVSGALAVVAALLKQPAGIAALLLIAYLWASARIETPTAGTDAGLRHVVWFTAGALSVTAIVAGWLWHDGILREAIYWTIGDHDLPRFFWGRAAIFTLAFCAGAAPLLVWTAAALMSPDLWRDSVMEKRALIGLLIVSAIGTAAGGRFYPHYFIQMLPGLCILGGVGVSAALQGRLRVPHGYPTVRASGIVTVMLAMAFAVSNTFFLRQHREPSASAVYIRTHSAAAARVFVWGQFAQEYLDAERRPASRYITTFPLTGYVFGGPIPGLDTSSRILPGAWDTLMQDLAVHPPEFIVDRERGPGALNPMERFPRLAALVAADYDARFTTPVDVVYERRAGRPLP